MKFLTKIKKSAWLTPLGLVFLSVIPILGGSIRMSQLSRGVVIPETERFYNSLTPLLIHIVASTIFSLIGAFQFSSALRKRNPKWHRIAGRILVMAGFAVALSGLWMTLTYEWAKFDGIAVYSARLIVGTMMTYFMYMGIDAIRRRQFLEHGDWMIRAYAIAMGAGTQVFTHIPFFMFPGIQGETARAICMISAWVLNVIVAEIIIQKPKMKTNNIAFLKGA